MELYPLAGLFCFAIKKCELTLFKQSWNKKGPRIRQEITFDISINAVYFPRKSAFDSVKKGLFLCIMLYFRRKYSV